MRLTFLILAMAVTARADVIVTRGIIHTGQVVKVVGNGVQIKVGENEFTALLPDIVSAEVAKPDAVEKNLAAYRAGKYPEALAGYRSIVDRYGGLPLPWAEDSVAKLGDVQIALKDFAGAKRTFDSFKLLYSKSPAVASLDVKYARIFLEQNEPAKALPLIQGVLDPLMKKEFLSEDQETAVAEGLILLGDSQVLAGKADDALDNYLKVITLFDVNDDRTAEAKYKAGKLLEARKNWRRAKQMYEELLKDNPSLAFADDVKKRLAAHPE